jgi:hypothetical protein
LQLQRPLYVDGFDDSLIRRVEVNKAKILADAGELRRRVAQTRALGDMLTGDIVARGTRTIRLSGVRNRAPLFPPVFLTFLDNLVWIAPTDAALLRMKNCLRGTPTIYREFVRHAADEPIGGLFELNIYDVLDRAFPGAQPQPRIAKSTRRADVRIMVDGTTVFVEATAMGEGAFHDGVARMMQERELSVYATWAPGPAVDARRIAVKISEKIGQTAPDAPNILCISFFGTDPIDMAREWAFTDVLNGGTTYSARADGTRLDLTNLDRVDTVFEFGRTTLRRTWINPNCAPAFRLLDSVRERIRVVFEQADLMIR